MEKAPYFEDFCIGDDFSDVPSITVTDGQAAVHQALFADRSPLFLSVELSEMATGSRRMLANPSLVVNIAIGQSTIPSQRVMGNLFYRGLHFRRPVFVGDTLTTTTRVVALRQNKIKEGRHASGMVGLEMHVINQAQETVLLFWRCPMIPCRDPLAITGLANNFDVMPEAIDDEQLIAALPDWNFTAIRERLSGKHFSDYHAGDIFNIEARDTITLAPELVRLTLNLAMTHTDATRSAYGKRLVYGGHTISMAAAHISRAVPNLLSILAWYRCDHTAPVFEFDILRTRVIFEEVVSSPDCGMAKLHVEVFADRGPEAPGDDKDIKVLDWQLAVLLA